MKSLIREKAASAGGFAYDAAAAPAASPIELSLACSERLRVHRFSVRETVSSLFAARVLARSPDPCLDLRAIGHSVGIAHTGAAPALDGETDETGGGGLGADAHHDGTTGLKADVLVFP